MGRGYYGRVITGKEEPTIGFMVAGTARPVATPAQLREILRVFGQWQPPAGTTMKSLNIAADGRHSFAMFEADSAALLSEATAAFTDYLDFEIFPLVTAEEAVPIMGRMQAWVDQMKG